MKNNIPQIGKHRTVLPSKRVLDQFGTNSMLALIHDAISHLVTPVCHLPQVVPALEQITDSLIKQESLLSEMLSIQKDAAVVHFIAKRLNGVPSLSHSALHRDLSFISVSKSYSLLFEFSPAQFRTMSLNDVLHPRDIPRFHKVIGLLLKGTVETCELVEWRRTGSDHFVLCKDTLWGIGSDRVQGPEYIATVSEKIADQDEAATLFESTRLRARAHSGEPPAS